MDAQGVFRTLLRAEQRMVRNYLAHRMGDAVNAILAAAGYNFRLLRRFIAQLLLCLIQVWAISALRRFKMASIA